MNANVFTHTIEMTNTEAKAAGKINTAAYTELLELKKAFPDYQINIVKPAKKVARFKGLDYNYMKAYIETRVNAEQIMSEYEAVKKMAEDSGISVYPFTKKWFLGEFDPDKQGFDMDKANEEISNYRIAKAVLSATPATNELALVG